MGGSSFTADEHVWMTRALRLAARARGRVEPDPMVGAVIVKNGRVVAEGYHRAFGAPHAEVDALVRVRRRAEGGTAYVTLEPCDHYGKTPPCTQALIAAKVARVVAAIGDPDPRVRGRGFARLRRAGIRVETGLCADEAAELVAPFLTRVCLHRPYTILKWAQSIDGKLATRRGESKWISGQTSRRAVHRLRARCDGILVGVGTLLRDDPELTARHTPLRRMATRIVLDTQLRTPGAARVVQSAGRVATLILTSAAALRLRARHVAALRRRGVDIEACGIRAGQIDLADALRRLAQREMSNILVEGGSRVLTSFFDAELADEAIIFVAPRLIGGADAPAAWAGRGRARLADASAARLVSVRKLGDDLCWRLRLTEPLTTAPGIETGRTARYNPGR